MIWALACFSGFKEVHRCYDFLDASFFLARFVLCWWLWA